MKNLYLFVACFIMLPLFSIAQLSGTRFFPSTDYPTLQSVADSLNLYGVGGNGITFKVEGNNVYSSNPVIFTATGTQNSPVTIAWNGEGTKPVFQFNGTAAANDAGITLKGSDYFTLDGLDIQNAASNLEYGIWITNLNAADGAHYNNVKNTTITLDKLNPAQTEGIKVSTLTVATTFNGNNHYNKFYNNTLQNMMIGYSFDGVNSTTTLMGMGNEVGTEFDGTSLITDIVMAGVLVDDQNGFKLFNTTIQNLTRIGSGTTAPAAISTLSGNPSEPLTGDFIFHDINIINATSSFTSVYGCYFSARKATYYIYNNLIKNITATGGGSNTADGIIVFGTDIIANVYNNMVSGIAAPATAISGNAASRGINVRSFSRANIYNNSVYMEYAATNLSHQSAAFIIYNNSDTVLMQNNIFINKTSFPDGATGIGAAFYKRTPDLSNVDPATDNNIYYAGTPSERNVIFYGHNSSAPAIDQILQLYKFRAGIFDQNAFTEDVPFVSADDLHVQPLAETVCRSNAIPVTTPVLINFDFDNEARDANTPDIGADEMANPYPDAAINPIPANNSTQQPVSIGLQWEYHSSSQFTNPQAFKVYLNTTPDFNGLDPVAIINFVEGVVAYSTNELLLQYETTYYWKVVPTTDINGGQETPDPAIWQFETKMFIFPYPNVSGNPIPTGTDEVSIDLLQLQWEHISLVNYSQPAGFKVYIGQSPTLTEADFLSWVTFVPGQLAYSASLSGFTLDYLTTYYWKVVPTVDQGVGPDAQGVETWSFTTELIQYPTVAVNPEPEDGGVIRLGNQLYVAFAWQFFTNPNHVLPISFKVFGAADTTTTAWEIPLTTIPYVAGQTDYSCDFTDNPNFNYAFDVPNYWKVIPVSAEGVESLNVSTWEFEFDEYLGLNETDELNMQLFPNPASDAVQIVSTLGENADMQLLDASGKIVKSWKSTGKLYKLDLSRFVDGVYFVSQTKDSKTVVQRLVVRRD
ncbi:MAG: hypothetical protein FD155_2014 [Bacteroidetes bacterium]|nr:MAG: hypothetical protein FD155_2014 [Bacteroidota bacterium]